MKKIEKILSLADNNQKKIIYSSIFLFSISAILYLFGHTKYFGYTANLEDNIFASVFPLIMCIQISKLHKIDNSKLDKRIVTYFYLLTFFTALFEVADELYCLFAKDASVIVVIIHFFILFIPFVILLYKTRDYYKKFADKLSLDIKNYFKLFIDSFK